MLNNRLSGIDARVRRELESQGFKGDQIKTEKVLHMRFDGSDTALMMYVFCPASSLRNTMTDDSSSEPEGGDFESAFKAAYKTEFGFLLTSQIVVDDVKVSQYNRLGRREGHVLISTGQGSRKDLRCAFRISV